LIKEIRNFITRGNVVDLAVAVVMGAAFSSVVTSFVKDILTPIITIPGKVDFSSLHLRIGGAVFAYGEFLNAVVSFLLVAIALFLFVVKPVNAATARRAAKAGASAPTSRECPECLSSIPVAARRCSFCTSMVDPHPES
jgi:large conductance mechanosensitive channel